MSQENVDLVLALQPAPEVDIAQLFRDDSRRVALIEALTPVVHPDFECAVPGWIDNLDPYSGIEGLTTIWLEWTGPWATYRTEIEEAIDVGDQVVVLVRDFARTEEDAPEVEMRGASVWTFRDGKIVRAEFYAERPEAFTAVGLADPGR